MDEIIVREAVQSDLPYFYEICLKTGADGNDASAFYFDKYLLGHYYAAPYLFFQAGICFVAEYHHRPQGYIIAAPDTAAFEKWKEEQWLPPLRKRYQQPFPQDFIRSEKEKELINLIHKQKYPADTAKQTWFVDYPAHLHIDLLPSLQGRGMGRTLMEKLFSELKQQGVPGLHLGVSLENTGAVAFYKKLGFLVLEEHDWGFLMGKSIT